MALTWAQGLTIFAWLSLEILCLAKVFPKGWSELNSLWDLSQNNCIAPNKFLLSFTQEVHHRLERWSGVRSLVALHLLKCQLLFCNLIRAHTHKKGVLPAQHILLGNCSFIFIDRWSDEHWMWFKISICQFSFNV